MTARQPERIPGTLVPDAERLEMAVSIRVKDATEGMLLLEELAFATRIRKTGPIPAPPKTRLLRAHEIRDGDYLILKGKSYFVEGATHDQGQVWLNARGLAPGCHYGRYAQVEIANCPIRPPKIWYELQLTKSAELSLRLDRHAQSLPAIDDAVGVVPSAGDHSNVSPINNSNDYRSVRWFGQSFTFTANQAIVVRQLIESWRNGTPDVAGATLLAAVDHEAPPSRMSTLFRDHPSWKQMIIQGGTKGAFRIADCPSKVS